MRKIGKIIKITLLTLVALPMAVIVISFIIGVYLYCKADALEPQAEIDLGKYELSVD